MTMGNTFAIVMTFVGFFLAMPCLWLLYGALWPNALGRSQERMLARPVVTFFVGVLTAGAFILATAGLSQLNLAVPAMIFGTFGAGWALFGTAALARHIGSRMPSNLEIPWRAHLRGAIVLELAFLFPLVGWILVLPISILLGAGATTLSFFRAPVAVREKAEVLA